MALSIDDVLWYLNEIRGGRYYCPYCGHDAFTVAASDDAKGLGETGPEYYGICCARCGHTAFFSAEIVREKSREEALRRGRSSALHDSAEPSPISQPVPRRSLAR
jgi:predicted nucleic-acid-binding Zn-ribbon protein